jgi:hypothetical protein
VGLTTGHQHPLPDGTATPDSRVDVVLALEPIERGIPGAVSCRLRSMTATVSYKAHPPRRSVRAGGGCLD